MDLLFFILRGALNTVKISIIALIGGTCFGLIMGLAHISRIRLLNIMAQVYSGVFRGIPILIWLFLIFFGIPLLTGQGVSISLTIYIGFILWTGAYMGEIFKAGIKSIPETQWKASRSLGMSYIQQMYYVILPQSLKVIIPPATGFFVGLVKDTSAAYILGYPELLRASRLVMQKTNAFFPILLGVAGIYFVICTPLSILAERLEVKEKH